MNLVEKSLSLRIFLKHVFIEVNWRKLKLQDSIICDWQSRGREFESHLLHDEAQCDCEFKFKKLTKLACVSFFVLRRLV